MCRHLAYLGRPATIAEVVLDPPHSLLHQSWAPSDMRHGGTINADGFGIAWLDSAAGGEPVARRYRRDIPMWSDASLPDLAVSLSSVAIMAAARSATVGMPVTETASAPFVGGHWMFSHNGKVSGWPDAVAVLAKDLTPVELATLEAPTDSAFLWALVRQRLQAGEAPASTVAGVVGDVLAVAPGSRLNLLLSDGARIVATTVDHSLSYLEDTGSVTVASEPLDPGDPRWVAVPDLCLLEATADGVSIRSCQEGWT